MDNLIDDLYEVIDDLHVMELMSMAMGPEDIARMRERVEAAVKALEKHREATSCR